MTGAFAIGTALFLARGWARIVHPGLWAEDGTRFLPESHTRGMQSIVHPFAGYIHVLPRLIALSVSQLPLTSVPMVYTLCALTATVLIFATVLSPRLHWLIPSRVARGLAFVLLCVMPDFSEPYGNLANLIFVGAVATVLLGLSTDPRTMLGKVGELVAIAVLVLSGPLSLITFPAYLHRLWRNRTRHSLAVGVVFGAAGCAQIGIYLNELRFTPGGGTAGIFVRASVIRLPGTWMAGAPDWYNDWLHSHMAIEGALWLMVVLVSAFGCLRGASAVPVLIAALAIGAAVHAYGPLMLRPTMDRHFLLPQALVICTMTAVLARAGTTLVAAVRARPQVSFRRIVIPLTFTVAAAATLLSGYQGIKRDIHIAAYTPRPVMSALQPCLATLSPQCRTPEAPAGWDAALTRAKPKP